MEMKEGLKLTGLWTEMMMVVMFVITVLKKEKVAKVMKTVVSEKS